MSILQQFKSINRLVSAGYNSHFNYDCVQLHEKFSRTLPLINQSKGVDRVVDLYPYSSQLNFSQPASYIIHDTELFYLNHRSSLPFLRYGDSYFGLDDFKLYKCDTDPSLRYLAKYLLSAALPPLHITSEPLLVIPGDMKCGFYHWIHDFLPSLIYLKRYVGDYSSYKLFLPSLLYKYQYSTLRLLSIDLTQILDLKSSPFNRILIGGSNKLISPLSIPGNPTPTTINLLTSEFVQKILVSPPSTRNLPSKFYIIRQKAGSNSQRVFYSDCAIEKLAKYGYSPVVLENLSFIDQCHLFAGAKSIISPHGAGLSLLFLAPKTARIVEIQNSPLHNPCYWALCNVCDLSYYCFDIYQGNKIQELSGRSVSTILELLCDQ
tara:strand:+ start:17361 stop:18491 length:1131 start_codon:yes stop_codon:yes gene_type:complete